MILVNKKAIETVIIRKAAVTTAFFSNLRYKPGLKLFGYIIFHEGILDIRNGMRLFYPIDDIPDLGEYFYHEGNIWEKPRIDIYFSSGEYVKKEFSSYKEAKKYVKRHFKNLIILKK